MKNEEKMVGYTKEELERYLTDKLNKDGYIYDNDLMGYDPDIFSHEQSPEWVSALSAKDRNKEEC